MTAHDDGPAGLPDDDWFRGAERIAIHGLGREGRSVLRMLADVNPDARVRVLDDHEPAAEHRALVASTGGELVVGAANAAKAVVGADLVVRSPGVPPSHPGQAAARTDGIHVTSALNLWFARHRPRNVVGVTGTKGKSTTVTLLGHLLRAAGRDVRVAGNVGLSVFDLDVPPAQLDHLVLELSSYQLCDLRGRLAVGLWINLHADHHAWHGGADAYAADKARIAELSDRLVVNLADAAIVEMTRGHPDRHGFDAGGDPVVAGGSTVPRAELLDALADSPLVGTHNLANLAAVLAVGDLLGVAPTSVLPALASFRPLPHRLQLVHDDGRRWVDDSIATIPEATVAALDAFPEAPVTLLAGGFERDQDHAPLVTTLLDRAHGPGPVTVVALPDTGHRLADELAATAVPVHLVTDLVTGVALADELTARGSVVLLSPAAASFNQFASFEERGHQFAELARTVG